MNRIEANVAAIAADHLRPHQQQLDTHQQAEAARVVAGEAVAKGAEVSAEAVASAAAELSQIVEVASGRRLEFSLAELNNIPVQPLIVSLQDRASGEVIKQIPGEEVLKLRQRLGDLIGMLIDERA